MREKVLAFVRSFIPKEPATFNLFAPLGLPIRILKVNGNWVTKDSSTAYKLFSGFLHLFVMEIGTAVQLAYLPQIKDFFDFTQLITMLPSSVAVCMQTFVVNYYKDEILLIMDMIRECVDEHGLSEKLKKRLSIVDKYMKGFFALTVFNVFSLIFYGLISRELLFKMWYPFDVNASPVNFWFVMFYQLGCLFNYCFVNLVMDTFPVFFMVYIIGMLEQLCDELGNIKKHRVLNPDWSINKSEKKDNRKELIKCIEYQLKILAINKKVEKVFSPIFLVRGFFSIAVLCTTLFAFIVIFDEAAKLTVYIIIMLISVFVPCYCGSKIKEISSQISHSLFHSEWMLENKEYRQLVRIAMEFAEKDMRINVAGFFDVDLEVFKTICQSVYSTYCICKRIMKIN
jgi:hypothetical protein